MKRVQLPKTCACRLKKLSFVNSNESSKTTTTRKITLSKPSTLPQTATICSTTYRLLWKEWKWRYWKMMEPHHKLTWPSWVNPIISSEIVYPLSAPLWKGRGMLKASLQVSGLFLRWSTIHTMNSKGVLSRFDWFLILPWRIYQKFQGS